MENEHRAHSHSRNMDEYHSGQIPTYEGPKYDRYTQNYHALDYSYNAAPRREHPRMHHTPHRGGKLHRAHPQYFKSSHRPHRDGIKHVDILPYSVQDDTNLHRSSSDSDFTPE